MDVTPGSEAFEAYVEPARARAELWRLLPGMVIILGLWLFWTVLVLVLYTIVKAAAGAPSNLVFDRMVKLVEGQSPEQIAWVLATFIGVWPALWLVLSGLHGRSFASLFSAAGSVSAAGFGVGLALAAGFFAISLGVAILLDGPPQATGIDMSTWALWIVPIALLVIGQASAEEAVFRGYLLQQLAARFSNPLIWGVGPSSLFGFLHFSGSLPGITPYLYVTATFLFGLAAAVLVWRSGGLAMAMGLHTGINLLGLGVVGLEGVMAGAQIWRFPMENAERLMLGDALATLLLLLFVLSPACPIILASGRERD